MSLMLFIEIKFPAFKVRLDKSPFFQKYLLNRIRNFCIEMAVTFLTDYFKLAYIFVYKNTTSMCFHRQGPSIDWIFSCSQNRSHIDR